jgi:hypothetical protein
MFCLLIYKINIFCISVSSLLTRRKLEGLGIQNLCRGHSSSSAVPDPSPLQSSTNQSFEFAPGVLFSFNHLRIASSVILTDVVNLDLNSLEAC